MKHHLSAFLFALTLPAKADSAPKTPEGLSDSDWTSIWASRKAAKHTFVENDDGTVSARNRGQAWNMEFDGRGFTATPDQVDWEWRLELDAPLTDPMTTVDNKPSVPRGNNVDEWFVNDRRKLKQKTKKFAKQLRNLPC